MSDGMVRLPRGSGAKPVSRFSAHGEEREDVAALRHVGDAEAGALVRRLGGRAACRRSGSRRAQIGCSPTTARRKLVLPTPFRPISAVTLPASAVSDTPRSAWAAP